VVTGTDGAVAGLAPIEVIAGALAVGSDTPSASEEVA
jgi:hypothetical protein